jgi:hypothetical protein
MTKRRLYDKVIDTQPNTTTNMTVQNTYGILTAVPIPNINELPPFNLWRWKSEFFIQFNQSRPIKILLSDEEFEAAKEFHLFLFGFILDRQPPPIHFIPSKKNYLIVSINIENDQHSSHSTVSINWKRMSRSLSFFTHIT